MRSKNLFHQRNMVNMPTVNRMYLGLCALTIVLQFILALPASAIQPSNSGDAKFDAELNRLIQNNRAQLQMKYGWIERAARARQNRKLLDSGVEALPPEDAGFGLRVSGSYQLPVLLVRFDGGATAPFTRSEVEDGIFAPTGSTLPGYYNEVSYGALDIQPSVYGWEQLPRTSAHYTDGSAGLVNRRRREKFVRAAVDAFDASVDFNDFDDDGDGIVETLMIVHQFASAETSGDMTSFNSLSSSYDNGYKTNDSAPGGGKVRILDYVIIGVLEDGSTPTEFTLKGPRSFAHEMGHAFGLPDLYDVTTTGSSCLSDDSFGVGGYCIMGSNLGPQPVQLCAWSKYQLGWLGLANVETTLVDWPLTSASTNPGALRLFSGGAVTDEYFIVELRTRDGFDVNLPADGVLIWHIDETREGDSGSNTDNANECRPRVDLECANQENADHILDHDDLAAASTGWNQRFSHMWQPGGIFGLTSTPSSISYTGFETRVQVIVKDAVGGSGYKATLSVGPLPTEGIDVCVRDCGSDTCTEPTACLKWWVSPDIFIDNNLDGFQDAPVPGQENLVHVVVRNIGGKSAVNVSVLLYYAEPSIGGSMPDDALFLESATIPTIGPFGASATATFNVVIPDGREWCYAAVLNVAGDLGVFTEPEASNNIAIRNRQEFASNAGEPIGLAPRGKAAPDFADTQSIMIINRAGPPGEYELVIGSPPSYSDAIIPPGWQVSWNPVTFALPTNGVQNVDVNVIKANPQNGDLLHLPLTCRHVATGTILGGDVFRWIIDTAPPQTPASLHAVLDARNTNGALRSGGATEEELPVLLSWEQASTDVIGGIEKFGHWEIYALADSSMALDDSLIVARAAIDIDLETSTYETRVPALSSPQDSWYRVVAVDHASNRSGVAETKLLILMDPPPVAAPSARIGKVWIRDIEPNPFNPRTVIHFSVQSDEVVSVVIYDVLGRKVRTLLSEPRSPGDYSLTWNGADDAGEVTASGVYFARLSQGSSTDVKKLTLIR